MLVDMSLSKLLFLTAFCIRVFLLSFGLDLSREAAAHDAVSSVLFHAERYQLVYCF